MLKKFNLFKDLLYNNEIKTPNKFFDEIISEFTFLFHEKENHHDQEILRIPNETQIIIADEYNELRENGQSTNKYYILTFSKILLIIDQNDFILYQDFFIKEKNSIIFCLNTKNLQKEIEELVSQKDPNISLHFSQQIESENLLDEIKNFSSKHAIISSKYSKFETIIKILNKNIIAFLIRKSYIESNINRMENNSELYKAASYKEDDINNYIILRHLSSGISSSIDLIMNENNGQLFALKRRSATKENRKLFNRENNDYSTISHPYLLRYYGTNIQQDQVNLILEFVNGETLNEIDLSKFDDIEKLNLIFSIMIVIQYIHFNNFIYRDLAPINLMIDQNNSIVLIDLDQMVKNTNENTGANSTHNFARDYVAPELRDRNDINVTEKADIYSLGWVINFIMNNKTEFSFKGFPSKFIDLLKICEQCVVENPEDRPSISKVIASFISNVYLNSIQKVSNNEKEKNLLKTLENNLTFSENINDPDALYTIGVIYEKGICIESNYEKAIEFLKRAASQNHSDSILDLGKISLLVYKDKKTAYELFQKAADLGNQYAQLQMGIFYATSQNKNYDIQKAIHYLTLSSNQNNPQAQYNLGQIYIISKDIPQDIPKGIKLYKQAAKQKIVKAQYNLGVFYFEGEFVKRDSIEAIKYLTEAADQDYVDAQYYLGFIYFEGKNFIHDIDKAIHYATLAANKNKMEAQRLLGKIYLKKIPAFHVYEEGKIIKFQFDKENSLDFNRDDLDKSIHYYSLAARQNDYISLFILYNIYMIVDVGLRNDKIFKYYKSQYNFFLDNHYFKFNKELIEYNGPLYGNNIEEVINYLKDLADQNDLQAKFALAFIYLDNVYIEKNIDKAIQYLTESADQGYLKSQLKISSFYLQGKIMKKDIEKGIEYLIKAANQNDFEAISLLFNIYTNGKYIKPDMNKVNELLDSIENQKNLELLKKFACICYEGKVIKKDINRVIKYLKIAENQGCIEATVQLGILYFEGKDVKQNYSTAFHYFSKASKRNNSYGQFYIGLMYFEGKGVEQNYFKSLHFFIQSSIQNNKYAFFYISMLLLDGKCIKKDVNRALFYLEKFCCRIPVLRYIYASIKIDGLYANLNANKGICHLQNQSCGVYERTYLKLGLIYTEGKLLKRCVNSAIFNFSKFLTNPLYDDQYKMHYFYNFKDKYSHHDIMKSIIYENSNLFNDNKQKKVLYDILFSKGKYSKVDINRIFYYFLNEASKNNPVDQFVIGSFYYEGINIKKDIKKSMQFFYYSSMQGCEDSMLALAVILTDGKFFERDIEKVIHLVSMMKSRIHPDLLFILGSLYYEGKYIQKNLNYAKNFFKDSSNFDNFYSKNNLGIFNRNGINVTKNQQQAIIYFQESIKINNDDNVASYNLAHLYFFENQINDLNKLFSLLIKLVNKGLFCAFELLCLIVYENYKFSKIDRKKFDEFLKKNDVKSRDLLVNNVFNYLIMEVSDSSCYQNFYDKIQKVQLIYVYYDGCIFPTIENDRIRNEFLAENVLSKANNLNQDFYNGFE